MRRLQGRPVQLLLPRARNTDARCTRCWLKESTAMNLPALIKSMDFATYLADPATEPSVTSSIAKQLNATAPWRVWLNTPRLNPNARAQHSDNFDLGTAAHALFVGGGDPLLRGRRQGLAHQGTLRKQRAHARESGHALRSSRRIMPTGSRRWPKPRSHGFLAAPRSRQPLEDADNLIRLKGRSSVQASGRDLPVSGRTSCGGTGGIAA